MCGFAGFLEAKQLPMEAEIILHTMGNAIQHRGPDDAGVWLDTNAKIGFSHRRLSIIDISTAGRQPMFSGSGRYVIIFNGEIYNHLSLRKALEVAGKAPIWQGHSDTETLLASFDVWGIRDTIKRVVGMFAFAVWDTERHALTLGRDRIGEKPLYYGWQGDTLLFGSELKALEAHASFQANICRGALSLFMRYGYVPAPYSIYQGIYKLEPGCLLSLSQHQYEPRIEKYWSVLDVVLHNNSLFKGSYEEAVTSLETITKEAIAQQMMADVPLGSFLSGGVDSSTVVALMQAQSMDAIKTFSIGFHETGYDEAPYAKAVAQHLGTDHTELYITADEALAVIPELPLLYDEPFADSSQIPTFLVSKLAAQHVTVALSGDAGDELFSGYNRYTMTHSWWGKLSAIPLPLRSLLKLGILSVPTLTWDRLGRFIPQTKQWAHLGDKLHKGAQTLTSSSMADLYLNLISHSQKLDSVVIDGYTPSTYFNTPPLHLRELNNIQYMMALDLVTYLPDDILVKIDRAAMGVSLETRVPFLDHRLVEFAWQLPLDLKLRDGQSKWILRQLLYKYVPQELIDRPKMGFGVPIGQWLRGPLRDWAEELLNPQRLQDEGFLEPSLVQEYWQEHLSGRRNWQHLLWNVLMFQAWLDSQGI